jgi:Helicase HerA, central domain/Type IV secretion-system coupling protein DNA-binding domain
MEHLALAENVTAYTEALTCVAAQGVVGFATVVRDSSAALEAAGLLPVGHAIACRISVLTDGAVTAAVRHLAPAGHVPCAALQQLAAWIFPGAICLPSDVTSIANSLKPVVAEAFRPVQSDTTPVRELNSKADELARPVQSWPWQIGQALAVLMRAGGGELELTVRHVARDAAILRQLQSRKAVSLAATYGTVATEEAQASLKAITAMLGDATLLSIEVAAGGASLGALERNLIARALYGTSHDEAASSDDATFRCLAGSAHAVCRIAPIAGEVEYLQRVQGLPPISSGLEIGRAGGLAAVRLEPDSRARHLYLIGATGTGKSTLLRSMIKQDVANGEGVILIDPHGDLSLQVAAAIPISRRRDVEFYDASVIESEFAISLLPTKRDPEAIESGADSLVRLFMEALYADTSNAFGPVFEQYFRNALMLLLSQPGEDDTLENLPRIFEDKDYRDLLLDGCCNSAIVSFWRETATKANGEMSLTNVTPYVTSKLTRLIGTAQARRIFSAPGHGIDFAAAMDAGKILILRCPKGELGEGLAGLVMAAALMQIQEAAMARASRQDRKPVRLYVDEFHGARGLALSTLLAEGRKFGVSLTLANQSLGQIDGARDRSLGAAILANVANLLVFRVGAPDAERLAPWLDRPERWRDLCNLPDFRMTGRILANGRPFNLTELGLPKCEGATV